MEPERDVYWAAEPLYYASRATGLVTFCYNSSGTVARGGPRLRTSPLAVAYAYVLSGALLAWLCMYVSWALDHGYRDTRTLAFHLGMRAIVYLCMFASVSLNACVFGRAPREALAAVSRADAQIWTKGAGRRACRRARACVLAQVLLAGAFFGAYIAVDVATQVDRYHTPYDWAFHFVPHLVPHVFNVVMGLQYTNWLLLLWSRTRAINRRLTPLAEAGALSPAATTLRRSGRKRHVVHPIPEAHPTAVAAAATALATPETTASRLRRLQRAHSALGEAAARVDAALGLPILLETCYLAAELVSRTYAFYRTGLFRHALWLAVAGFRLAAAATPAHACGSASRRTAELLGRASLAPPPDADGRRALRDFSRQAEAHPLLFSTAGIFVVDATLLLKVMVAAVTYIIIAVQFECKQQAT